MSQELLYTSAPHGLLPGSQGFCTVAATRGLSAAWREALEALCSYRPLFPPTDPRNPITHAHLRLTIGGRPRSVLARIGPQGFDYTGRANKFAHLLVLDPDEQPEAGPAWLLSRPGVLQAEWDGRVGWRDGAPAVPRGSAPSGVCTAWERLTGDAGWAGVVAETVVSEPSRPAVLIFEPGTDLLPLFAEAVLLLPPKRRWEATFSTFFTSLPPAVGCLWRGVVVGTPEAAAARGLPGTLVLDLTESLGQAIEAGPLVEMARTGRPPVANHQQAPAAEWPVALSPITSRPTAAFDRSQSAVLPRCSPPPPPVRRMAESPSRRGRWAVWLLLLGLLGSGSVAGVRLWNLELSDQPRDGKQQETVADDRLITNYANALMTITEWGAQARALVIQYAEKQPKFKSAAKRYDAYRMQVVHFTTKQCETYRMIVDECASTFHIFVPAAPAEFVRPLRPDKGTGKASPAIESKQSAKTFAQVSLLPPGQNEIDLSRHLNIPMSEDVRIRLLPRPNSKLHAKTEGPVKRLRVSADILTGNNRFARTYVPRDFVEFAVERGNIKLLVVYKGNGAEQAWKDLYDSVLEASLPSGVVSHIALRQADQGSIERAIPGIANKLFLMTLRWNEYAKCPPQGQLLIRACQLKWNGEPFDFESDDKPFIMRTNKGISIQVSKSGTQLEIIAESPDPKASVEFLELIQRVDAVNEPVVVFRCGVERKKDKPTAGSKTP